MLFSRGGGGVRDQVANQQLLLLLLPHFWLLLLLLLINTHNTHVSQSRALLLNNKIRSFVSDYYYSTVSMCVFPFSLSLPLIESPWMRLMVFVSVFLLMLSFFLFCCYFCSIIDRFFIIFTGSRTDKGNEKVRERKWKDNCRNGRYCDHCGQPRLLMKDQVLWESSKGRKK